MRSCCGPQAAPISEKGKEAVVALHEKGNFFGEGCLNGHRRRLATVTAVTECEIMRFDKATMAHALHDEPKFSELFISHLLARNVRVEADLVDQLFNFEREAPGEAASVDGKFRQGGKARARSSEGQPRDSRRDDRHDEIAGEFFMNRFRKLGFIDYNGGLEVQLIIEHGFA
jgi:CRP-like cAMP-binding protein